MSVSASECDQQADYECQKSGGDRFQEMETVFLLSEKYFIRNNRTEQNRSAARAVCVFDIALYSCVSEAIRLTLCGKTYLLMKCRRYIFEVFSADRIQEKHKCLNHSIQTDVFY